MELPRKGNNRASDLKTFAEELIKIDKATGFKVSSRGWCYQLEGLGLVTKQEFNRVNNLINECRKNGMLPIDFVAEEEARNFHGVWIPNTDSPSGDVRSWIEATLNAGQNYNPDYWDGEKYYIQMLVEKVDLVSLFQPVCEEYYIPIATSKGWSSILQRAEIAERFNEMEETGHIPVLLYCGDFDPAGIGISDALMKNFKDIELGTEWEPNNLIIDRFGLNYEFIQENNLSWIENLETGGGYIAEYESRQIVQGRTNNGRPHPDFNQPATQEYLHTVGIRKCEANALVVNPAAGRQMCRDAIENYMGCDVFDRYRSKKQEVLDDFDELFIMNEIKEPLLQALDRL